MTHRRLGALEESLRSSLKAEALPEEVSALLQLTLPSPAQACRLQGGDDGLTD